MSLQIVNHFLLFGEVLHLSAELRIDELLSRLGHVVLSVVLLADGNIRLLEVVHRFSGCTGIIHALSLI